MAANIFTSLLKLVVLMPLLIAVGSCITSEKDDDPEANIPSVTTEQATKLVPAKVKDRTGWATDIIAALEIAERKPTKDRVCAVIAVIEQESGFQVDPAVRNISNIVRNGLLEKLKPLGSLAEPALAALLTGKAPGSDVPFSKRIDRLRTEKDLDQLYRDIAAAYRDKAPGTYFVTSALSKLLGKGGFEDWNPVTTAGSMQVKISFAEKLKGFEGLNTEEIREKLYTRAGGIEAGTARLFHYEASYDKQIYRFADYNVGVYASRNAAFQTMISDLTKEKLDLDGDLLAYRTNERPNGIDTNSLKAMLVFAKDIDLSEHEVRMAAGKEKTQDFEETKMWEITRATWEEQKKKKPPYAIVPAVKLNSPKITGNRTTAWFAKSVDRRYQNCLKR
jgi:hypothetical protein